MVDVFNDFGHEDGDRLLGSFRERAPNMARVLDAARRASLPVVYANDEWNGWQGDAPRLVDASLKGKGGDLLGALVPHDGDPFLLKHRYSAFDHTSLELLLESMEISRVVLIGAATEGCVVQTAIDARELGLKASIVRNACATTDPAVEQIALRYAALVGGVHVERDVDG